MYLSLDDRRKRILLSKQKKLDVLVTSYPNLDFPPRSSDDISPISPKIYGYVRVSTEKQGRLGISLDVQEKEIKKYCSFHNLPLPIIFCDSGLSAKNMTNRPEFMTMVSLLKPGDSVIAYSLSRLSRSTSDMFQFMQKMKLRHITVICMFEGFNLTYVNGELSAQSQLQLNLAATMCEFEASQTRERTLASLEQLRSEGKLRSKPHFGWTYVNKLPVEVPEEQEIIDFISDCLYEDKDLSLANLTKRVNFELSEKRLKFSPMRKTHKVDQKMHSAQISRIIEHNNLRL